LIPKGNLANDAAAITVRLLQFVEHLIWRA
jgi:hypothetical protein